MTLPPRPEPECIDAGLGGEWSGLIFGDREIRKHIKYCEENPSVANWWEPLFTIDQLKARELEIIEACKAIAFRHLGPLPCFGPHGLFAQLDKLKEEL